MLQQPEPDDYVVATGECHSVREFVELAFSHAGLDYRKYVKTDKQLYRPAEINLLKGDAAKARASSSGWTHRVMRFEERSSQARWCSDRSALPGPLGVKRW